MATTEVKRILSGPAASTDEKETNAHLILDLKCDLGENILYDNKRDCILFTDIDGKAMHKLDLTTGEHRMFPCPKMLGSFAMTTSPTTLLCAFDDVFQLYDIEHNKALSEPSRGEVVNPSGLPTRLNDGRCDRSGAYFICGGFYGGDETKRMKVYAVKKQRKNGTTVSLQHAPIVDDMRVTNSICFSLDGSTMYLADSPTKSIHAYEYTNGTIQNKTLVHETNVGVPDGSCIDVDGYIWNAIWRSGAGPSFVNRINPQNGEIVYQVKMPDSTSQVTCCCFGGEELNVLFITTASEGRSEQEPYAGGLYAVKLPFTGLTESRFQL